MKDITVSVSKTYHVKIGSGLLPSLGQEVTSLCKASTAAIRLPAKCAGCNAKDICHACAAMVFTESGSFDKAPQYRCDMMKAYPGCWQQVKTEHL